MNNRFILIIPKNYGILVKKLLGVEKMDDIFDLTGKYALVVGASSGLGKQFAKALARFGANVAVSARRVEKLEELKEELEDMGVKCIAVPCDVSDEDSILKCVDAVMDEFGRIDILCNNAGIDIFNDLFTFTTEMWDATMDTNIRGMFLMSREVGKIMKEQESGKIINTASIGGRFASEGNIAYYASKGAVINFTRGLAADLAPYNVNVNAIAPGVFETELTRDSFETDFGKESLARIPFKRPGRDGDLDGILIYFASDASNYCTGQTIFIDGGSTMIL